MICEIASKSIVPAIKAKVVKELYTKHNLSQVEISKLMGITQASVSYYLNKKRGSVVNLDTEQIKDKIKIHVDTIVDILKSNEVHSRFSEIQNHFCSICYTVRKENLLCDVHKHFEKKFNLDSCNICQTLELKCEMDQYLE